MESAIESVLDYWFGKPPADQSEMDECYERWFKGTQANDARISRLFSADHRAATEGALDAWAEGASGRLALIVLLDQFSRNIYRGTLGAFEQDERALLLTLTGLELGLDTELAPLQRGFFYMPMQHAESLAVQEQSVEMFDALAQSDVTPFVKKALVSFAGFARLHRDIIARFGRFPHRNSIFGREGTEEERLYLAEGGATFGQ